MHLNSKRLLCEMSSKCIIDFALIQEKRKKKKLLRSHASAKFNEHFFLLSNN